VAHTPHRSPAATASPCQTTRNYSYSSTRSNSRSRIRPSGSGSSWVKTLHPFSADGNRTPLLELERIIVSPLAELLCTSSQRQKELAARLAGEPGRARMVLQDDGRIC
jgi:hypothetical protein